MSFLGIPELTVVCTECSLAAWRILVVSLGFCVNFASLWLYDWLSSTGEEEMCEYLTIVPVLPFILRKRRTWWKSGSRGGNTLGTAVPCGLSLHTTCTCVNSTFIKPTLNYPNLSVPSVFSWDFDRYSLIEAIYWAMIGHKHPSIYYESAFQYITT